MDEPRCLGVTKRGQQCKHYKLNTDLLCSLHKQNAYKPKQIFFKDIKIKNISKEEYIYLSNYISNQNIMNINHNIIMNLLKDYNNQIEFNKRLKLEQEQLIENNKIDQIQTCKCCLLDDYDDINLIRCSKISSENAHKICFDCFINHVEIQLKDNNVTLKCMFNSSDNCNGDYDIDIIRSLIDEEKFNKYSDFYAMSEVKELAKTIDNYQICPSCLKYGIEVNVKNNEKTDIKCLRCEKSWCNLCKKISHKNHCYVIDYTNYDKIKNEDKIIMIDNIINEIISKKLMHYCPYCNTSYIKIDGEGCNMMTCTNCKGYSCYVCGEKIIPKNNSHYYHFKGHALNDGTGTCPLFNNGIGVTRAEGNRRYNINKIMDELDILLNVNNNIEIQKIIYSRIKNYYKNEVSNDVINKINNLGKKYKLDSTCIIL